MRAARSLAVVAALSAFATACGGGGTSATKAPKVSAADERKAEKDAKGLVTEIYQTISRSSNTDGLMALLAEPLVVFGPRRTDAHATRSDALVAMKTFIDDLGKDNKPTVSSGSLEVVASPGGMSAWAVDVVEVQGQPMAMTAVLSNDDDFWVVVAATLARTPSAKAVRLELAKDAVVPPGMPGPSKVEGAADGAVERFKRGLADPTSWGDDLGKRSDAVVIGPSSGQVTRGKKEIAKLWKKRAKANTRYAPAGDITAATTRDGQLAWVSAPVVQFADEDDPLPLRLFSIYEKAGSEWKMIALQEAVAVDEPGVGANFRKITPPAIKADEPPPPKPKTDDKPKKKKKKKASD
jgi:ketosteroid isomerase-like protein